jgi:AraC-like DNA-binding protein
VTEIIDGKQVFLQQGDLLLVNLYTDHGVMPLGREDLAVNFSISPDFLDHAQGMAQGQSLTTNLLRDFLRKEQGAGKYLHYRTGKHLPIQNLLELILAQLYPPLNHPRIRWPEADTEAIITSAFSMILLYLSKDLAHLDENGPLNYDQFTLETIRRYLTECYQTANLSELATLLSCSQSTLSRNIKRLTGMAFTELLQEKRLNLACGLLLHGDQPITEIAHSVGYENVSYFYRCFEKQYGITPRQFREKGAVAADQSAS